jgi:hypothetical protein
MGKVRKEVLEEFLRMQRLGAYSENLKLTTLAMRKRLLYLFVKDLSSGVSGEVLLRKSQRDLTISRKLDRVSLWHKVMAGLFVGLLDGGMLFYVYLFAMNQTHSRQQAWFVSFVMWLGFEIILSSTAVVLVLHLLIPLYVWSDVSEVKKKVLKDLIEFQEKYLKRNATRDVTGIDIETGSGSEAGGSREFNAAKFLFPSWRVASLFPEIPESQLVLRFSTPWPKKPFGKEEGDVAKEYEDDVVSSAAWNVLLYFLASLLHYSSFVQDIFVQTVCNMGLGSLCILLIQLWKVYPWLSGLVVLVLLLCACGLGRLSLNNLAKKLQEAEEEKASVVDSDQKLGYSPHHTNTDQRKISPSSSALMPTQEAEISVIPSPNVAKERNDFGHSGENRNDHVSLGDRCLQGSEEHQPMHLSQFPLKQSTAGGLQEREILSSDSEGSNCSMRSEEKDGIYESEKGSSSSEGEGFIGQLPLDEIILSSDESEGSEDVNEEEEESGSSSSDLIITVVKVK